MIEKAKARIRPTFRPSRSGIGQVLGDLEREIMEALWRHGELATVTETLSKMSGERRAYHTVTTVMVRLCEKRLLQRRRRGGVWHYSPRLSREEFKRQVASEVIAGVYALAPESAVNSMLDLVDASHPKGLEELASLVEQKRRERRGKK
ncbi:MAG TPA: BlaI/MecI/CopY family transcriptional regulator [Gemmatimonadaceae bacterium]